MPLEYSGTISEHLACRNSCAMFDVSHLGTVRLSESDAAHRVNTTLTNNIHKIEPGRAQYTHLLNNTGGVLDDIIVWWHHDGTIDVMPNASNTASVRDALGGEDITRDRAVIAVQGPEAKRVSSMVFPDFGEVGRFRVADLNWKGIPCTVAGTGYTGEPGIEISVAVDAAPSLWIALADAGATPSGLGARDTLRLEAGLPLHGHELGPEITPLQAGLSWVVAFDTEFVGKEALLAERETGISRQLVGISTAGRRPPRADSRIVSAGIDVGAVTSCNFSPVLQHGIAMGFVPPTLTVGDSVSIDIRGTEVPGTITAMPFV
jgi:aminomethyltransferase